MRRGHWARTRRLRAVTRCACRRSARRERHRWTTPQSRVTACCSASEHEGAAARSVRLGLSFWRPFAPWRGRGMTRRAARVAGVLGNGEVRLTWRAAERSLQLHVDHSMVAFVFGTSTRMRRRSSSYVVDALVAKTFPSRGESPLRDVVLCSVVGAVAFSPTHSRCPRRELPPWPGEARADPA